MSLVPPDFAVPPGLETEAFKLRKLTVADAALDYEAVMESRHRLRAGSPHGWPREGFTLAENRADLVTHEREFDERYAFTYTVVTPDESRVLGCVYIRPSTSADADVYMWMRDAAHDAGEGGLTRSLFHAVKRWLEQDWPFAKVSYVRTGYYLAGSG